MALDLDAGALLRRQTCLVATWTAQQQPEQGEALRPRQAGAQAGAQALSNWAPGPGVAGDPAALAGAGGLLGLPAAVAQRLADAPKLRISRKR